MKGPEAFETGLFEHVLQPLLSCLGAQREPYFLRHGSRTADESREPVEDPADRIEIVGEIVMGEGLDQHEGAVGVERPADMGGGALGVAHVVQAVEAGDEVVVVAGIVLGEPDLEAGVRCPMRHGLRPRMRTVN